MRVADYTPDGSGALGSSGAYCNLGPPIARRNLLSSLKTLDSWMDDRIHVVADIVAYFLNDRQTFV